MKYHCSICSQTLKEEKGCYPTHVRRVGGSKPCPNSGRPVPKKTNKKKLSEAKRRWSNPLPITQGGASRGVN